MKTMIDWIKVEDCLPDTSREVWGLTPLGGVTSIPYSKKHKLFNVFDKWNKSMAHSSKIEVKYWADIPYEVNKIYNDYISSI